MVSQMARAKYLGEPFMAHLENLYNIVTYQLSDLSVMLLLEPC